MCYNHGDCEPYAIWPPFDSGWGPLKGQLRVLVVLGARLGVFSKPGGL